jgi:hypothetical protein
MPARAGVDDAKSRGKYGGAVGVGDRKVRILTVEVSENPQPGSGRRGSGGGAEASARSGIGHPPTTGPRGFDYRTMLMSSVSSVSLEVMTRALAW